MIDNFNKTEKEIRSILDGLVIQGAEARTRSYTNNIEFRTSNAYCTLYVDLDCAYETDKIIDMYGNKFRTYHVQVKVSYPCYSSDTLDVVQERVQLISEVIKIGKALEERFAGRQVLSLVSTVADREKQAKQALYNKAKAEVIKFCSENQKNMRVGNMKTLVHTLEDYNLAKRTIKENYLIACGWKRIPGEFSGSHQKI